MPLSPEEFRDLVLDIRTTCHYLAVIRRPVRPATLRKWVARGKMPARGYDRDGRSLYRMGDVLDLINGDHDRRRHRGRR